MTDRLVLVRALAEAQAEIRKAKARIATLEQALLRLHRAVLTAAEKTTK